MSLVGLRDAIVASIRVNVAAFRVVQPHGGRFNAAELKRIATQAPAALVAMLGGPLEREGGQAVGAVQMFVFVVTGGTSTTKRDEDALLLAEAVAGLMSENKWAYADAQAPSRARLDNLYSGEIDRLGVALWAISWTQRADVAIFDASALDDLNTVQPTMDLAPADGLVESTQVVELQGTLMSAYGHLNMATAVATPIAVPGTYQKAAGTTALNLASGFDSPVTGRLRHLGTVARPCLVRASASVQVSADAKVTLALAKNGVPDPDTAIEEEMTLAGEVEAFSLDGIMSLTTNDHVEVWVTADDTINVTLTKLSLAVAAT